MKSRDMDKYKVNSYPDNGAFLITLSYEKLIKIFESLKTGKGRIIHVVGAPGTGKSINIFHGIEEASLKVYNVKLNLKSGDNSSKEVYNQMFHDLAADLGQESREELYEKMTRYDALLIADSFHDAHLFNANNIGFSQWTQRKGIRSLYFYLLAIKEYFKQRRYFKGMNLIFQTAWRVNFRGKKYDIFTDLGFLSKIMVKILQIFFEVVEISYTDKETIEIVKLYIPDAGDELIKQKIKIYGHKPRFICHALENK